MKYYDLTKFESTISKVCKLGYEIIYITSINKYKCSITTFSSRVALYEYLKAFNQEVFNLRIFKNGKDITEKVNKMLKKL